MSIKWTDEEIDLMTKMNEAHKTPEQVAQVLKSRSVDSIRNKGDRMDQSNKPTF